MCGIFGYVGQGDILDILTEGIRRLEYRGYDSWGLAVGRPGTLSVFRRKGRVEGMSPEFRREATDAWGGIAHTRWATHGEPSERNAHPHTDATGRIAVVHNGVIENFEPLRSALKAKGVPFKSDTDTEVIAHLIARFYDGANLRAAFLKALRVLDGAYAIAMTCADCPGEIWLARNSSPLVAAQTGEFAVAASDAGAVVPFTRDVVYLGDGEFGRLRPDGLMLWNLADEPVEREAKTVDFDVADMDRGGYTHFMLKEIHEQPQTIVNAMRGRLDRANATARLDGLGLTESAVRDLRSVRILACGTSWHAGLIGRSMIESMARLPVHVDYAAEFRYGAGLVERDGLVVAISQSGETADTLAALREAKRQGARVEGICNVVGSSVARECGAGLYLHAGPELGVASTKAFTSQLVVLSLFSLFLARACGMPLSEAVRFLDALEALPEQAEAMLKKSADTEGIAHAMSGARNALYIGRQYEYPLALEGALKLKEVSYIHAEGIPAAELKHGPIALIDPEMPTVVLGAQSAVLDKMTTNVREIRSRGGRVFAVAREGCDAFDALAERVLALPSAPDALTPILGAIPLQLIAYYAALERGCDVDRPRNLAKSVTVE